MGLLYYLQKTIASFLRPWILQKDLLEPLLLRIHLTQIVLELQSLELDCAFINSSLLSTSPSLLHYARLGYAKLTISFFRSPGISLTARGLHFACHIRPPEDSFWSEREKRLAKVSKKEAIAALDPLGASVHSAAERHAREGTTSGMLRAFMAVVLLQALRVELYDASSELHSNAADCGNVVYSLTFDSLILEEGYGFVGAFVRRLINIFKKADYYFCKICSAQNLGLQFSSSEERLGELKSTVSSNELTGSESKNHLEKKHVLLWRTVTLIIGFQNIELNGLDALFAETVVQFNFAEAEAFVITFSQLQGASRASHTVFRSKRRQPSSKVAKYLWQRAFEKITGGPLRKLKNTVQAGMMRQRYSRLYASWLVKAREGIFGDVGFLSARKKSARKKGDLHSLERDLSYLEEELPIEAVVLARFLARNKALRYPHKLTTHNKLTAQRSVSDAWNKIVLYLTELWEVIKKGFKTMARVLKRLFDVLSTFFNNTFLTIGFGWIFQKFMKGVYLFNQRLLVLRKVSTRSDMGHLHLPAALPEGLDKSELLRSKNMQGRIYFKSIFHTGSVTFIGSMDYFPRNCLRNLLMGSLIDSVEEGNLPGVHFAFGNVSVVYSTHAMALGFELVCEYLQGQVISIPVRHLDIDTGAQSYRHDVFIKKEEAKFFQSGPSPEVRLLASVKDQFEARNPSEKDLSHAAIFLNFVKKEKISFSSSEKAHDCNVRPFIICAYESHWTPYTASEQNLDMTMCSLAVGCINFKFSLETYNLLGLLLVQLLDIVRANKQPFDNEICQPNVTSSTIVPTESCWEVLYAGKLRLSVSSLTFKREFWLLTALAGPKLEFLGGFVSNASSTKAGGGAVSFEPVLLMDFGHLELTIWPAVEEQDELPTEKSDDGLEDPVYSARKRRVWLRHLPSPDIPGEEVVRSSFQHEEIGNNGTVSLQGAVLSLRAFHGPQISELVRPINMLWEFSLCRDDFISASGLCNVASAAVMGSISPIQMEFLFEELELLYEVFKKILIETQKLLDLKKTLEVSRCEEEQEFRNEDDVSMVRRNSFSVHQLSYFSVSLEIRVDVFGCSLIDRRIIDGEQNGGQQNKRADQMSVKTLWLNFSWGDGCTLLFSCGTEELSLLVVNNMGDSENNFKRGNVLNSWKGNNVALKENEGNNVENGKCQLLVRHLSCRFRRPWCLSAMETLQSTHFEKHQNLAHKETDCWMNADFEMDNLYVCDGESNNLIRKALSRLADASCLKIDVAISKDYKSVSVISEGGMLFFHTQALLVLLHELRSILSSKTVAMKKNNGDVLLTSFSRNRSKNEGLVLPSSLGRSLSLPLRQSQERQFHQERLYSAPFESHIVDVQEAIAADSQIWSLEDCSIKVSSLCFTLAQIESTSLGQEQGALLLEIGGNLRLQTSLTRQKLSLKTEKLRSSILREGKDSGRMMSQLSRIPRFGSSSSLHAGADGRNAVGMSALLSNATSLLIDRDEMTAKSGQLISEDNEKLLSKKMTMERGNDHILENVSISLELDKGSAYLGQLNGWSGSCALLGLEIGITISEIQLLLVLISSISSLPLPYVKDEPKPTLDSNIAPSNLMRDNTFHIPDGSIVALKDVQEHLYMAVERAENNSYRLTGVLHYSLAGDWALFKVKYQKNYKDASNQWFSLLSVAAKNGEGEAFRVHYRPGSGLADVSSIHDGSWELWKTQPYKYSAKEGDGDIDLYSDLNNNLFHLVNQKSKQGLTLATGSPMMVKQPGSPFKFKVLQVGVRNKPFTQVEMQTLSTNVHESKDHPSYPGAAIPKVEVKVGRIVFTLLYESGGGKYLLPLLRGCLEDTEPVMHIQPHKIRVIGGCKLLFEYLEAHVSEWSMIIQPVYIGLFYRLRTAREFSDDRVKLPVSFFARCKRVDITISEKSLDIMLFVIGIMNLAGPYSIRYSPVLATRCKVENHTGLDLRCSFDDQELKEALKISAWKTEMFFVRNMMSRRDSWPAKMLSSVSFNLEKEGVGLSSSVPASLLEPSLTAIRTRLEREDGEKRTAGPIIVVEVSKHNQDGIIVTVSPMTRVRNCTGLTLELRCRRPSGDAEGVTVLLKDGDIVDDSMGAFDALNLEGELKKALSSFSLGDYLLSVRPVGPVSLFSLGSVNGDMKGQEFDWSQDITGAKPIHISGFLEKMQYGFRKSLKGRNAADSFGTVFCASNFKEDDDQNVSKDNKGMHIVIRVTSRYVPLLSVNASDKPGVSRPIVAWQEQKELVLLPTLCIQNFLDLRISIVSRAGAGKSSFDHDASIEQGCKVSLFADLAELVFAINLDNLNLASQDISLGDWSKSIDSSAAPVDYVNELETDLNFGDNSWCAKLKMFRANDGVLQVIVYSQYAVKNTSDIALLFCMPKQSRYLWALWNRGGNMQWPAGEAGTALSPGAKMSLLKRSSYLLLQMAERLSETAALDLESFSGSTQLSLRICHEDGLIVETQLGVRMEIAPTGSTDPTRTINIGSRFIALNESPEAIFICQDELQVDESAAVLLKAGEHISLKTQFYPGLKRSNLPSTQSAGSDATNSSIFSIRFRLQKNDWDWSGPICASALGSFYLRIHKRSDNPLNVQDRETEDEDVYKFMSVDVRDESPSLVIRFCLKSADAVPYRIENALSHTSISFYQKGLNDIVTTLKPGKTVGYAWDNLSQPHKLIVLVSGTQLHNEIKLDKLGPWKSFRAARQKKVFGLQLPFEPFENQRDTTVSSDVTNGGVSVLFDPIKVGYEISADGSQRVLRVCEDVLSSKLTKWQSHISFPSARMDFRVPAFGITFVENQKHKETGVSGEISADMYRLSPIISMRMSNLFFEVLNTQKHFLFQLKVETLSVDERWEGAPFSAMLRVHSEDRFKKGETVLHMAAIVSNQALNPIHVKYSSILLQTIDVNLDEETLMKLVPFYRYSLAESTSSRQIYFERFEIHPIKIVASFLPSQTLADYTSAQEAFRALLHSFIKVPSIRGSTVELNGVLLTHALLTFRQLAIKCAQHYSWYAMRAVYIAKGSKLLPPAFTSLFDDSAASSLDVFFDPSNGSIDLQGLTLGMFNFLSDGLKNRGLSGTSRYIGDLERTIKTAGSNILFTILTEVSDNVLKGAETGGLDGMVNGFRRGILNVSMEPSLLRTAVVKGGSSRRIKLDHSAGTDEMYVEGYLQAMLDTLYQQNYLKVKVVDDQVFLKNLPPNSVLVEEIMGSVKNFLVREGLLAGEISARAMHSWRRLQGESDKRIVPAVAALCEQLFVIFAVRALRNQTRSWFYQGLHSSRVASSSWARFIRKETDGKGQTDTEDGQVRSKGMRGIMFSFVVSSAMAYIDGRLCRHIPNTLARRVVSGFLLSFVE